MSRYVTSVLCVLCFVYVCECVFVCVCRCLHLRVYTLACVLCLD